MWVKQADHVRGGTHEKEDSSEDYQEVSAEEEANIPDALA